MNEEQTKELESKFLEIMDGAIDSKVAKSVSAEVQKAVVKMNAENLANQGKDASGISSESAKKFSDSLKAMTDGSIKSINVAEDTEGGFGIPTEIWGSIIRLTETFGVITPLAQRYPFTAKGLEIVRNAQGVFLGVFVGDKEGTGEENITFGLKSISKETWQTIFGISRSALKFSVVDYVNFIMSLIAEGIAGRIEHDLLVAGSSAESVTSPFVGIMGDSDVPQFVLTTGNVDFADFTIDDANLMVAQIKKSALARGGVGFWISRTVWATLKNLKDGSGQFLIRQDATTAQLLMAQNDEGVSPAGFMAGYPVFTSDFMPEISDSAVSTQFIIFGSATAGLAWGTDMTSPEILESDTAIVGNMNGFTDRVKFFRANIDSAHGVVEPLAFVVGVTAAS
ncbi:MAG: phage major capsid protein [Candidatus Peribacteraceae bacterium]|nr:phage major capsid protein [Candidatus Peribacteraceae bacterium]